MYLTGIERSETIYGGVSWVCCLVDTLISDLISYFLNEKEISKNRRKNCGWEWRNPGKGTVNASCFSPST